MSPSTSIVPRRAERTCRLIEWKPWPFENPSLIGHATISFAGGWTVHAIPIFRRGDGRLSAGVPNAAQVDAEGRIKQRDGKRQYTAVISFETAEARERWQRMIQAALAEAGVAVPEAAQ